MFSKCLLAFPVELLAHPWAHLSAFCILELGEGWVKRWWCVQIQALVQGQHSALSFAELLDGGGFSVMPGGAVKAELLQPPSAPALEGFCWPCRSAMVHREDQWIEKSLAVWSKVIQSTWQAIWALTLPTEKPAAREDARWISKTLWHPLAEVYSRTKRPQFTSQLHDLQVFAPWQVI